MKTYLIKHWIIILILGLTLLTAWPLILPGYFSHHDDLQVMRVFEMRACILDFQIPCRWVPHMGYGNGYPLFNYYAVLPYYIGAILSFFLGFVWATKVLFAIPLFLGGVSMFLLAKELFGKIPALLASMLYTFAPYHALDSYVRGDITESFAMALIPLAFYFSLRLIKQGGVKNMVGLSISLALFLISHNIMTVLFVPVLMVVCTYWLMEKTKKLPLLIMSFLLAVGISSFFIFPAYFEKELVQIDNLIRLDLDFRAHFVNLNQLFFDRSWNYGASSPGPNDTISFQIGWPHWFIALASAAIALVSLKKYPRRSSFILLLFGIFIFSIFMTHTKSAFLWEKIEILKFTQFPWRFLAVSVFSISLLGAALLQNFREPYRNYLSVGLIVLTIFLNWNYFQPKAYYLDLTDQKKLSGPLWEEQQKAAILDYLPKTSVQPREGAPTGPIIISGNAIVNNFENKSNRWKFNISVLEASRVEVPIFDFPNWMVDVNGKRSNFSNKNYLGRISIDFDSAGEYLVEGNFTDTPIRRITNAISLISLVVLFWLIFYGKSKKLYS